MSESESSWYTERGELEVHPTIAIPDDHCNHLNCILWDMRQRANLRKTYQPRPKPEYQAPVIKVSENHPKPCVIGKRPRYSLLIMRGIYQLHRRGLSDALIADHLGMPLEDVARIMEHKTGTSDKEWRRVQAEKDCPQVDDIVFSLAKEAEYVYGKSPKAA